MLVLLCVFVEVEDFYQLEVSRGKHPHLLSTVHSSSESSLLPTFFDILDEIHRDMYFPSFFERER